MQHRGREIEAHRARHIRRKRQRQGARSGADVEQRLVGDRLHVLDQREARDAFEVDLADRVVAILLGELAADLCRSGRPALVPGPLAHDQALAAASTGSPARRYASMPPVTLRTRSPARSSTLAAITLR